MKITRYPESYAIGNEFREAREVHFAEGACVYAAEKQNQYFVIVDSRTTLDFFEGEEREDLAGAIVAVYEFETEAERAAYLSEKGITPKRGSHAN